MRIADNFHPHIVIITPIKRANISIRFIIHLMTVSKKTSSKALGELRLTTPASEIVVSSDSQRSVTLQLSTFIVAIVTSIRSERISFMRRRRTENSFVSCKSRLEISYFTSPLGAKQKKGERFKWVNWAFKQHLASCSFHVLRPEDDLANKINFAETTNLCVKHINPIVNP